MSIWHGNEVETALSAALSSASVFASVDSSTGFPTSGELESDSIWCFAELFDDGVTQAEPELVWVAGAVGGSSVSIEHRGMMGTSIPASWPIDTTLRIVNRHEIIDCGASLHTGYSTHCIGWVSTAAANPFTGKIRFHGGADPEASTDLAVNDTLEGWDVGNILGELAAGDLVIVKYFMSEVPGSQTVSGGTFRPGRRIEFKIDTGGPTDNTGWWEIPIDSTYHVHHDDLPNTTDGVTGLVHLEFMKLV